MAAFSRNVRSRSAASSLACRLNARCASERDAVSRRSSARPARIVSDRVLWTDRRAIRALELSAQKSVGLCWYLHGRGRYNCTVVTCTVARFRVDV